MKRKWRLTTVIIAIVVFYVFCQLAENFKIFVWLTLLPFACLAWFVVGPDGYWPYRNHDNKHISE